MQANKEHIAPSVIEILRIMDETIEAFFLLPIPIRPAIVTDLMSGLDRCLQQYTMKAKSCCGKFWRTNFFGLQNHFPIAIPDFIFSFVHAGSRNTYMPSLPGLTRCSAGSKFFKKKEKSQVPVRRKAQAGSTNMDDPFGISQLCVRINTMQRIRSGADALEKKTIMYLKNSGSTEVDSGLRTTFELSIAASLEGIQQLCEATGYKVVFHELSHVLWDGLYAGEVSSSRIEPFLQELEQYLEIIATTVHDRVRTRAITEVMKASFDGFLLVLLAGGPSRAFTQQETTMIEEDFKFLCDLFWSNGDGLPSELIENLSRTVKAILPLLRMNTESLIEQFRQVTMASYGSSDKSRLPLPPMTGQWGPSDPNTLLRVLCHRDDEVAAKFLKRNYNLPKKV